MYGPGFIVVRQANKDYKVPETNITIPKGSSVWVPALALHYDDRYWENPKKFNPNRFTSEEVAKRPAQCFIPFGDGPRNCKYTKFFEDFLHIFGYFTKILINFPGLLIKA